MKRLSRIIAPALLGLALAGCAARERPADTRLVTLEVGGMTCGACVEAIRAELTATDGVRGVEAAPDDARFTVTCDAALADTALTAAVRRAGPQYLGMVVAP